MVRIGLYSEDRSFKPLLSSALGRDYQVLLETDEDGINRLIDTRGCDVALLDLDTRHASLQRRVDSVARIIEAHDSAVSLVLA
jgi:hypothetical protein